MSLRSYSKWFAAMLPLCALAQAQQDDMRTLIEQALNEPARVSIENSTLSEAIEQLSKQTGVQIVMTPETMSLTPNGPQTPVRRLDISDMSVRDGLNAIFSRLGMHFEVRDDRVEIVPDEAIYNLGRTPTWTELETLTSLAKSQPGTDPDALAALQGKIQFAVSTPDARKRLTDAIKHIGAGPGDELMTLACKQLGWTWTLDGDRIVVTSLDEEIQRRLQNPISLRVSGRPLLDVFQMLSDRIRVDIFTEPGALASLSPEVRNHFSLTVYDKPADEVLYTIAEYTGLGYLIETDGVLFYDASNGAHRAAADPAESLAADPYVAVIDVPLNDGTSFRWLVRRSELPEDLRQRREGDLRKAFEAIRKLDDAAQP